MIIVGERKTDATADDYTPIITIQMCYYVHTVDILYKLLLPHLLAAAALNCEKIISDTLKGTIGVRNA
jgi:hypothetical protein